MRKLCARDSHRVAGQRIRSTVSTKATAVEQDVRFLVRFARGREMFKEQLLSPRSVSSDLSSCTGPENLTLFATGPMERRNYRRVSDTYPGAVVLVPLHHQLELLVDFGVFGLGPRSQIVLDRVRLRTLWRHGTLMFLLVECLQVSADRFT